MCVCALVKTCHIRCVLSINVRIEFLLSNFHVSFGSCADFTATYIFLFFFHLNFAVSHSYNDSTESHMLIGLGAIFFCPLLSLHKKRSSQQLFGFLDDDERMKRRWMKLKKKKKNNRKIFIDSMINIIYAWKVNGSKNQDQKNIPVRRTDSFESIMRLSLVYLCLIRNGNEPSQTTKTEMK